MIEHFENYAIVNGSDTRRKTAQADLERKVMDAMEKGWQPLGGVVYLGTETVEGFTCHVFCQTLVKPSIVEWLREDDA